MGHRAFVKVVGFSPAERHALNTLFRLSDERHAAYTLWTPESPEPPGLLLIDGSVAEAHPELQLPIANQARLVWVGAQAPGTAWRVFQRPIAWPEVIAAIDTLFESEPKPTAEPDAGVDVEIGATAEAQDTQPPDTLPPEPRPLQPRALIASADRDHRLYYRARLALAGLTSVDEAGTAGDALECAKRNTYRIVIIEHQLPQVDGWFVLKRLRAIGPDRPAMILLKQGPTLVDRLRGWAAGASLLPTPPDPGALDTVLRSIATGAAQAAPALTAESH